MAEFPYLPLWTDAFLADTMHLNTEETGAYLLLLMHAWRHPDCTLPDDDTMLARYARVSTRRWPAVKPSITPFWTKGDDGRLSQKRLTLERNRVVGRLKQARAASAASAKARGLKSKQTASASAKRPLKRPVNEPPTETRASQSQSHKQFKLEPQSNADGPTGQRAEGAPAGPPASAIGDLVGNLICTTCSKPRTNRHGTCPNCGAQTPAHHVESVDDTDQPPPETSAA